MERVSERTIVCDGRRFTRAKNKKYYRNTKLKTDLHRYIWQRANGEIPKGYHIHHVDGDTENNDLTNLKCISATKHCREHSKERVKIQDFKDFQRKGIEAAKDWHRSAEGRKWHKEHYDKMKDKLYKKYVKICNCCGKEFEGLYPSKFCSNKCKSKFRRDSGIDNISRKCKLCGKTFTTNKYSKAEFCSISCGKTKIKPLNN